MGAELGLALRIRASRGSGMQVHVLLLQVMLWIYDTSDIRIPLRE